MFDPYQTWLGIPPGKQPPTYYQLLGIEPSEKNKRVIEEAASRQSKRLQQHRLGKNATVCQRILNEIAQARAVLLDPIKRKAYDARLAQQSTEAKRAGEGPAPKNKPSGRTAPFLLLLGIGAVLLMLGGSLVATALVAVIWFDVGGFFDARNNKEHAAVDQIKGKKLFGDPLDKEQKKGIDTKDDEKMKSIDPKRNDKTPTPDPKDNPKEKPPTMEPPGAYRCKTLLSEPLPERGPVTAVACSADGRSIAWAHGAGVRMYSPATGKTTSKDEPTLRGARVLAFSDDGSQFAAASTNHNVYLWKNNDKKASEFLHASVVRSLAFSPDGKYLLTGSQENDSSVCLFETVNGQLIRTFKGHTKTVSAVGFSADGQGMFSSGQDKMIRWNRDQDEPTATYRAESPFGVSGFLPGGRFALGITNHHPLLLWDLDLNSEARRFPSRKGTSPYSIACSANGKVAAVGFEKLVQVFDIEDGRELAALAGHDDWVWTLALPADGRFIVTGSKDGTVLLWEKGFTPLFNGKDLTGWKSVLKGGGEDDGRVFSVRDGVLTVSGQPHGYLYTKASYRNYLIRLDWRYERPKDLVNDRSFQGDSGLLMHITGDAKVWPESIQVQWYHQEYGLIYLVPHIQNKNYTWNRSAVDRAMHRVGEWNRTEVLSQNGRITCTLNGIEVCVGNGKLLEGQIGLQSEGATLHFKRIDIQELP